MPQWTEAQEKTIYTRDRNILVSAAAGSGKTAVLVERIIRLIIDEKADIDSFLITTFTKAASEEMKQRLEKAIRDEMRKPGTDRKFLLKQLQLLPGAAIGTFHSFAIDIIRQYFYLTDLEPGFQITDEVRTVIMKRDAVRELMDRRYEEGSREFLDFLTRHSSDRNDSRFMESLINTYQALRSIPHYMQWAEERTAMMAADDPVREMGIDRFIAEETQIALEEAADFYEEAAGLMDTPYTQTICGKAMEDAIRIRDIAAIAARGADGFGGVRDFLMKPGLNTMRATKEEKENYERVKEQVKELRDQGKKKLDAIKKRFYLSSEADWNEEIRAVHEDTVYFLEMIREFEEIFRKMKSEAGCIDFDDVMHYAIEVLDQEQAAAEQRERFRYIFIDEYQDSNMLQETVIGSIARENNLFMVGDVKQSIYKFRLAEPEIFMGKAADYRHSEDEDSIVIDLNNNFRSKLAVTSAVNRVFEKVMPGYDDDAALHCTCSPEYPGSDTGIHIISKESAEEGGASQLEGAEEAVIAQLVRDALGQEIYDTKKNCIRKVEYRDIAVLSRASAGVADIERYLNNENIPSYGETDGGYFESVEIQVFSNLLRVIDNMRQDVALISVMRSPVFAFSVRELAEIRISGRSGSYYNAVRSYARRGENQSLRDKTTEMIRQIDVWKETGATLPLDEFMRMLMYDTGYYDYCSGLPAGRQRISNLQLIIEKAASFEEVSHEGLHGFLRYIEAMAEGKISEGMAKTIGEGENVVRVMTVHKSKGLEFPVVILAGAGKKITAGAGKPSASLHKDFGMCLALVDTDSHYKKKTILQNVITAKKAREDMDEAVRILYVAMTRAKDRLEITGTVKSQKDLARRPGTASYLDMVYPSLAGQEMVTVMMHDMPSEETEHESQTRASAAELRLLRGQSSVSEDIRTEINRRLSFEYESQAGSGKLKYAVTELGGSHRQEISVAEFQPDMKKHKLTRAEIGTLMHLVMEKLDFAKAKTEGLHYIEEVADALLADGSMEVEERAAVNVENIAAFFETSVGARAAAADEAGRLHKEREFILEKEVEGSMAVVQGIIDCWFQEDDGLVLIDYKNVYAGKGRTIEEIRETYSSQTGIYRQALEASTGLKVKETYLYLFGQREFVKMQ